MKLSSGKWKKHPCEDCGYETNNKMYCSGCLKDRSEKMKFLREKTTTEALKDMKKAKEQFFAANYADVTANVREVNLRGAYRVMLSKEWIIKKAKQLEK